MRRVCPECHDGEALLEVFETLEALPLAYLEITETGSVHAEPNFDKQSETLTTQPIGVACATCGWKSEHYGGQPWWFSTLDEDAALVDPEESDG